MDYDFSGICADHIEKLAKRLKSINKSYVRDYELGMQVINNQKANDHAGEIFIEIEDILNDVNTKAQIIYKEALNKVIRILGKHL